MSVDVEPSNNGYFLGPNDVVTIKDRRKPPPPIPKEVEALVNKVCKKFGPRLDSFLLGATFVTYRPYSGELRFYMPDGTVQLGWAKC